MTCTNAYCDLCRDDVGTASPTVQSAPAAERDFDPHQLVALFDSLDARGKALTWNLMECAKRLQRQGQRG